MKYQRLLVVALSALTLASCGGNGGGNDSKPVGPVKVITIDGGGDVSNFNTTASMTPSDANPYPYNTLETLCKEWEATHPGYQVKINKTSSGGSREVLLPQLKTHTACDIIYQNGGVVNTDLGNDYYVNLTPYLEKENPYNNNKPWRDVYDAGELATTQAADGNIYYANLEKIPVCFMYNKTLLGQAGVSDPGSIRTFAELMNAMTKCDNYIKGLGSAGVGMETYSTTYTWYQIAMESNMFADLVPLGDVLRTNKRVDTEEMCRLVTKKIFDPAKGITDYSNADANDYAENRYYEYIDLIHTLDSHKAPASYYATQGWLTGKLGFIEATGALLRTLSTGQAADFEWGTICFPDVTTESATHAAKGVVRGSAGLATSWWISNTAVDGDKVDACVDLMMFLTSPAQNNRLIGDLKGGIPLNPAPETELADYLKPLIAQYEADIQEARNDARCYWGAFSTPEVLGTSYGNLFIRTMQEVDAGTTSVKQAACILAKSMANTVKSYTVEYDYDTSKW